MIFNYIYLTQNYVFILSADSNIIIINKILLNMYERQRCNFYMDKFCLYS